MRELNNLKAYVLTTKVNSRLVNEKILTYPTCLPKYEVVYGITSEDNVTVPEWYADPNDISKDDPNLVGFYCTYYSQKKIICDHADKYPDYPLLFLEDDVAFEPSFNEYYANFMQMVPDDWDVITFGGRPVNNKLTVYMGNAVSGTVLRVSKFYGSECVLISPSCAKKLAYKYENDRDFMAHSLDYILNSLIALNEVNVYTPLYSFAYQRRSISTISRSDSDYSKDRTFKYKDIKGNTIINSRDDLDKYISRIDNYTGTKAYVLVNPYNNRLVDNKIPTYPSCLPEYDVRWGYTLDDNLDVPNWYREHRGCRDNEKRKRGYCAFLGHMHSIEAHYKKYPNANLIIMEDDVEFDPNFNEYYANFMKMVPDDWDAIYFGGWYGKGNPDEVVPNVLKVNITCRLYGAECILLHARLVKRLVDFLHGEDHAPGLQLDGTLADWAQQDIIKTYTPITTFAHQQICFSAIANKITDRNCSRHSVVEYKSLDGTNKISSNDDLFRYRDTPDTRIRAYVLTNNVNNRLVDNKIPTYPSCLPEYKVIFGPTVKENGLTAPPRFIGSKGILDPNVRNSLFCCFTGTIRVLKDHLENHPDDLILFMEDDVEFEPNFNEYYFNFMKMVPDDWDIINFGGFGVLKANEVKENVLSITAMAGLECCLMKPAVARSLVYYYENCKKNMIMNDQILNTWVESGIYKRYTPIYRFAYQKSSYALNCNEVTVSTGDQSRSTFKYTNLAGNVVCNNIEDLNRYTNTDFDDKGGLKVYAYSVNKDKLVIDNYPDTLPEPIVFSNSVLLLLKEHIFRYPNSDALIFDRSVSFNKLFNYMYYSFMQNVPDDWGLVFFGGKYGANSTKINDLVLKVTSIEHNDCFMLKSDAIQDFITFLENNNTIFLNSDIDITKLNISAYTPFVRFASSINSSYLEVNKPLATLISNPLPYLLQYTDLDDTIKSATYENVIPYIKTYLPNTHVFIPVYGGVGNAFFFICFGRWLKSLGIKVTFVDNVMWGQQTYDFIKDVVDEPLSNVPFKVRMRDADKYRILYDDIHIGQHWYTTFYPELRNFIDLGNVELKPIIGINVRRGDFLSSAYKNKVPAFLDLCETSYYKNAASICNKLGLPVRIISDELDKIPEDTIKLFKDPELMHGTFKEDFYNFAECKYKFLSNSTFSYWSAYAAPDATVFYPKGCRDDIKLDEWIALDTDPIYTVKS